jgi:predicted glycosyltransferase
VGAYNILFISGSIGLGHATRDIAIAGEIRRQCRDIVITWLAAGQARKLLEQGGELLLEESDFYFDVNEAAEAASDRTRLNLFQYGDRAGKGWLCNIALFKDILRRYSFDLVVADEAYEISYFFGRAKSDSVPPFAEIIDFVGFSPMSNRLSERLKLWVMNRMWARSGKKRSERYHTLFVGEPDDVSDERFGLFLPGRKEYAEASCRFLGYVVGFAPNDYRDRGEVRRRLGYGEKPFVLCSSGGTSIGAELLRLCCSAYPLLEERLGSLQMVVVCGPCISPASIKAPEGIAVKGFVPDLYEHFAACDIAVVQGGGSSTLELTALNRPFIFFPLEDHFEQQVYIPSRLARHRAGIRGSYSQTTAASLADMICDHIRKPVDYRYVPTDGAEKAARYIIELLPDRRVTTGSSAASCAGRGSSDTYRNGQE